MLTNKEYLVRIYTAEHSPIDAVHIAQEVKDLFPGAKIIGASATKMIYQGDILENGCIIAWSEFSQTQIIIGHYCYEGISPSELAERVANDANGKCTKVMYMHFANNYAHAYEFLSCFNKYTSDVRAVGGLVSEVGEYAPFVFDDYGYYPNSLLTASLISDELYIYSNAIIGHEPIGEYYQINKVDGEYCDEIDRKSALEWCKEMFGINKAAEGKTMEDTITDILLHFPFILEGHNGASMFLHCENGTERMKLFHSTLPPGQMVRIGYLSPLSTVTECKEVCEEIERQPIEEIVCYSCIFRYLYMEACARWELLPFAAVNICGIYCNGEIAWVHGRNEFLNGSLSFFGYAEQEVYLAVDKTPFKKIYEIQRDERQDVLNYVLRRQSENIMKKNRALMRQVLHQEQEVNKKLFIDSNTGLYNYTKYLYDNKDNIYNKLCMISMENGQILLNHLQTEKFEKVINCCIQNMVNYVRSIGEQNNIIFYHLDEFSFAVVAKEEYSSNLFLKIMQEMYVQFGSSNVTEDNIACIHQFILVIEQNHLLDKAKLTLVENKRASKRFMMYKSDDEREIHIGQALDIVVALNNAIKQQNVIPFFQPIYDNKNHRLNKFEALMRIPDKNGGILVPYQFMDIAKEYRLYAQLSNIMVHKVFEMFDGRDEMVSINLSAYDINSDEFTGMIFRELMHLSHPEHFIFEILESEEFRNPEILEEFVQHARNYGVKIAIDDFGSGYSNLVEVANLQPDFIKIDGQIVRYIQENEVCRKLVDIIVYLSERLNIELVAEFVKSEELQQYLVGKGIRYSQGYYFSPPVPYSQLDGLLKRYNR